MKETISTLPPLIQEYLTNSGFWAGPADFDFWYAVSHEEHFWLHLRRAGILTLALSIFSLDDGFIELDLYNLSRAPIHGLRATIANTPLMELERYEPSRPLVALRLRNGASRYFTLPQHPTTLADEWLAEALARLHTALNERWHMLHTTWHADRHELLSLWPEWAGPRPDIV
ncbi:MAG: hypothetical protein M3220_02145 [Chloroflexota bacterium]|nr:hypothetical protein [Chloroflexota bacterium]